MPRRGGTGSTRLQSFPRCGGWCLRGHRAQIFKAVQVQSQTMYQAVNCNGWPQVGDSSDMTLDLGTPHLNREQIELRTAICTNDSFEMDRAALDFPCFDLCPSKGDNICSMLFLSMREILKKIMLASLYSPGHILLVTGVTVF